MFRVIAGDWVGLERGQGGERPGLTAGGRGEVRLGTCQVQIGQISDDGGWLADCQATLIGWLSSLATVVGWRSATVTLIGWRGILVTLLAGRVPRRR